MRFFYTGIFATCCVLNAAVADASLYIPAGAKVSLGGGSIRLGCRDLTSEGVLDTTGTGSLSMRNLEIESSGKLMMGSGTISVAGDWKNLGAISIGSGLVVMTDGCGVSTAVVTGQSSFFNLNVTSAQGKVFQFPSGLTQTIANRLIVEGVPNSPLVLKSSGQTKAIFDVQGDLEVSYADTSMVDLPDAGPEEGINSGLPVWLLWYANENKES